MKTLRRLRAAMRAEGYTRVVVETTKDADGWSCVIRRRRASVPHGWGSGRSRAEAVRAAFATRCFHG